MKVHYYMGRKPKNRFTESLLVFHEGIKIKVFDMEIPFVYKFTVTPINQTGYEEWERHVERSENLPLLKAEIEKQGYSVTKIEPSVRKLTDLCPKCYMRGTPKIEKKNTSDNRERTWRNKEETSTKTKRPIEYWLTYTHSRHKKCRIRQYTNKPYPAYKKNDIKIEKYFFPYILDGMKKGSIKYADQPQ